MSLQVRSRRRRGTGTIFRLHPSSCYWIAFWWKGKRYKESVNGDDKETAENLLKTRIALGPVERINDFKRTRIYGKCPVCQRDPVALVHDHCHVTGKMRGRICQRCNSLLGFCADNVEILRGAIEYLAQPLGSIWKVQQKEQDILDGDELRKAAQRMNMAADNG